MKRILAIAFAGCLIGQVAKAQTIYECGMYTDGKVPTFEEEVRDAPIIFTGKPIDVQPNREGWKTSNLCWVTFDVEEILKGKIEKNPLFAVGYNHIDLWPEDYNKPETCPLKKGTSYLIYAFISEVRGRDVSWIYFTLAACEPVPVAAKSQEKIKRIKQLLNHPSKGE